MALSWHCHGTLVFTACSACYQPTEQWFFFFFFFSFFFFKERLGLKLTYKRITTKVVLPASKGKGAIQGEVKMCKEGESYDDKLLKSPKVRR